jgi:hypothetical protein
MGGSQERLEEPSGSNTSLYPEEKSKKGRSGYVQGCLGPTNYCLLLEEFQVFSYAQSLVGKSMWETWKMQGGFSNQSIPSGSYGL